MAIVALITWLITAGFGSWMLAVWVRRGGLSRGTTAPESHLPAARVFSHFGLAAVGLIIWIAYLAVESATLAWIAFADLVLVALLGGVLVARWSKDRRGRTGAVRAASSDLAEQHFPVVAVALHGVFAVTTLVLVLLTAAGVGAG
jgi:manganese efflux pump family protein